MFDPIYHMTLDRNYFEILHFDREEIKILSLCIRYYRHHYIAFFNM